MPDSKGMAVRILQTQTVLTLASKQIGCDRASPCSNCVSVKLDCTHSAIAISAAAQTKQSITLSAQ